MPRVLDLRVATEQRIAHCELEKRKAIRKAKFELLTARKLAKQWDNRELTYQNWQRWQEKLLHAFWNGSLQRRLEEITRLG